MTHMVYFAQSDSGLIKIGYCKDLQYRVYSLRHETRGGIKVLFTTAADMESDVARKLERSFHEKFAEHRVRGEWFNPVAPIFAFLAEQAVSSPSETRVVT